MESGFGTTEEHRDSVGSPGDGAVRRERASIAAQACETCRQRKSKCDEKRPKCSLCLRLNVECRYREPQPTKKDKTMVEIRDDIKAVQDDTSHIKDSTHRIERELKLISRQLSPGGLSAFNAPKAPSIVPSSTLPLSSSFYVPDDATHSLSPEGQSLVNNDYAGRYKNVTAPHKVLLWPAISRHMIKKRVTGLESLLDVAHTGTPWILRHDILKHSGVLPALPLVVSVRMPKGVGFPALNEDVMMRYTEAYFSTFNGLFPILDQKGFEKDLARIIQQGFGDDDMGSVMVLMVLSLGVVADQGAHGVRLRSDSGIRGGTAAEPPGLELFSEARRRMGFVMTHCSVENIQCLLLMSLYYESCARHLDFWRCVSAAAAACQVIIRCEQIDWDHPHGIAMKRVFWTCHLIESWFHLDLDLPQAGLSKLENKVPLPREGGGSVSTDIEYNLLHFSALEWLRKVISRIQWEISQATNHSDLPTDESGSPPIHIINELKYQLETFRTNLPLALQWSDNDRFAYPSPNGRGVSGTLQQLFGLEQGHAETWRHGILDMLTAQLRSRYYYAEFMVYRSFVFKALHHAHLMTHEDREMAARCLKSATLWPIAMWPCKDRKRLVPVLFAWTQNFLGVLLVLRMVSVNECLNGIMEQYLDEKEVEHTIYLLLDWMRDVKQMDGIAEWSWSILESLYDDVAGKY